MEGTDRQRPEGGDAFGKRVQEKTRFQQERYRGSLEELAGVMLDEGAVAGAETSDPLLAACMMVGRAAGIAITAPPPEAEGSHEDPLQAICRYSGVRVRRVTLHGDRGWWEHENGPILAFLKEEGRPVALLPEASGGYRLADPAGGGEGRIDAAVAAGIDGERAWVFYRPLPQKALLGREIIGFGLRGSGKDLTLTLFYGIAGALLGLLTPILTGILFGTVIPHSSRSQLLQLSLILAASVVATSGFGLARQLALMRLQTRMDMHVQPALIDRLLNLPSTFFRKFSSGDLTMRVLGVSQIKEILSSAVMTTILGLLFGLSNLLLLFYYSWQLALLALLLTLLLVGLTAGVSYRQLVLNTQMLEVRGRISGLLGNLLTGIAKIRVTGTEKSAFSQWAGLFARERTLAFEAGGLQNVLATTTASFPVVAMAVIVVSAGSMLFGTHLDSGSFIAFTTAYTSFQTSLIQSAMTIIASLNVVPLYERIRPVFESVPEATEHQAQPGRLQGRIEVQNVDFRYAEDSPQILHDVSLRVEPGEFVAIVGGSGSGKSTLLRLLLGFEKPDLGTVSYDGVDLSTLNVQAVRRQIGVVMQNGQLQPGFVLHSIIGSSTLTVDEAWEAAKMAGIDEDIRAMPMGMYTVLSEGSGTISGGQKQRLLIAGALVRKPSVIFFDEATSALDNRTQEVVSESLDGLRSTRIVIAHRLSTIRNADRIYCLEGGRIVQQGTYEELMAVEGFFRELAIRQIA
ncbi:NHLP bacteriocin export ABC transporter permease/ATPase subunit [Chlorobium sp. N1]|uniref:NHLP bacteriocin export ABC transporter permease/ATPase subunit n=1 Tax=Chlorobium sp. N1 TaxID=2491138 RepID=UPI00103D0A63|nr:NHLP bacteriocin export ABC transporter permease/ATPase subunit [Chlorobium sp. N1]TCD47940.1 NHLP bacteriocin export ABC transporter permease/ATPase subunit [Chlorobium sp. N1]